MKPTDQTKFDEDGNCMAACVASILEIPIESVPCQVETDNWLKELNDWMQDEHKLCLVPVDWTGHHFRGYVILGGPGPRGANHACVGKLVKGQLSVVHDPHPSRAGLDEIQDVMIFAKAD